MNRSDFQDFITTQPRLLDGAMGTVLHTRGHALDRCFDALNRSDPAIVAEVHRAYIAAGADIIETNTFGANRYRLAEFHLENEVASINRAAVTIARRVIESTFKPVLLAGSVGPLGVRLAPLGRVSPAEAHAAFAEQIDALTRAGIDLLIIETLSDVAEVKAAVQAARAVSAQLPIVVTMTFTQDDRTLMGLNSAEITTQLAKLDIDMLGVNCSGGPAQLLRLLATMRQVAPDLPLAASPNAGWPEQASDGRVLYPATPTYFADYARAFVEAGVNVVGGCCGTTDAHIAAMRIALDSEKPSGIPQPHIEIIAEEKRVTVSAEPPTQLATALANNDFITTVEMRPPKGIAANKMLAGAALLKQAGVTFLNVADIPLARMRMSGWAAAYLIQQEIGLETILHFPTRGRNLLRIQADLLAAHSLGIRNLFVTMGDPARIGDYPEAMDSYDIVPTGLIQLIKAQLNAGRDKVGAKIDQPTNFVVGCAASLTPRDPDKETRLLNKKVRFGADFALTQPVFDPVQAERLLAHYRSRYGELSLPILVGVQPLYNRRNAEFLHNEVPGISIPAVYRERMAQAKDPQREGVMIALEIVGAIRGMVQGVYIIPAFGRYDIAADLIEQIGEA